MLTPLFKLYQTDEALMLNLHIPLADLGNSEFLIEDEIVFFTAPPYYLRLELPGSVKEDDDYVNFALEGEYITVTMQKTTPGEHFNNLDLISNFLNKPSAAGKSSKPDIQELNSTITPEGDTIYDWFAPSTEIPPEDDDYNNTQNVSVNTYPYGFAAAKMGLLKGKPEVCIPIDLPSPDFCPIGKRHHLQSHLTREKFNPEHYIADFCEPEAASSALRHMPPWFNECLDKPNFTDEHRHRLIVLSTHPLPLLPPLPPTDKKDIINTEYHCTSVEDNRAFVYLGLVDMLLAYTHDLCVREGEENSESAWMIAKLAPTLSWLVLFPNIRLILETFYQRALSYPMVRSWELCQKVQSAVAALLQHEHAKSWILFILLEIRSMFIEYSGYYVFVDLFFDDYIVWLQKSASSFVLKDLGAKIASVKVMKSDVNLPLIELEALSVEILESEKLTTSLEDMKLNSASS